MAEESSPEVAWLVRPPEAGHVHIAGSIGEDVDLCLALGNQGYDVLLEPRSRVWHHESSSSEGAFKRFLFGRNQRRRRMIRYLIRRAPGVQTPEETLAAGAGSCRDTAWLLVQIMRHIGLPARFVSGYLIQLTPDVKSLDGPTGPVADFTDLHAWCEVYLPGAG